MAWKCKECGSNVYTDIEGTIDSGWGYADENGAVDKLEDESMDWCSIWNTCEKCGNNSKDLEKIATWEEN